MASQLRSVDPTPRPSQPPLPGHVDIGTASERLGISREGVRQRIRRGQLDGVKLDRQWWVVLETPTSAAPANQSVGSTVASTTEPNTTQLVEPTTASQAPNGDPTSWVNSALVAQLTTENQFLRQECDRLHTLLQTEQDSRRSEVASLHDLLKHVVVPAASVPPPSPSRPWWAFWRPRIASVDDSGAAPPE